MVTGPLEAVTEPSELHRMHGPPVRAWGRDGRHIVRMPIARVSGRRIERTENGS
jgi:hypothetical protein